MAAKKHIVKIRKKKFSIGSGAESNPLTEDLHHAVHISLSNCITKHIYVLMKSWQRSLLLSPSQQTQYRILAVAYYCFTLCTDWFVCRLLYFVYRLGY